GTTVFKPLNMVNMALIGRTITVLPHTCRVLGGHSGGERLEVSPELHAPHPKPGVGHAPPEQQTRRITGTPAEAASAS
ncbi:hypothetical protein, partial [uncultured Corynebacterium sp.]|uniref:hypothetical protein n=1 Tax=uncultured Corynebacterium sp. TaxID=159447 RepID=UPI0025EAC439